MFFSSTSLLIAGDAQRSHRLGLPLSSTWPVAQGGSRPVTPAEQGGGGGGGGSSGQGGLLLPGEGEVAELSRLVREEFLPTNVGSLGVENMSLPCSQQAADIDYWPEIHFIQSCVSPYSFFLI